MQKHFPSCTFTIYNVLVFQKSHFIPDIQCWCTISVVFSIFFTHKTSFSLTFIEKIRKPFEIFFTNSTVLNTWKFLNELIIYRRKNMEIWLALREFTCQDWTTVNFFIKIWSHKETVPTLPPPQFGHLEKILSRGCGGVRVTHFAEMFRCVGGWPIEIFLIGGRGREKWFVWDIDAHLEVPRSLLCIKLKQTKTFTRNSLINPY